MVSHVLQTPSSWDKHTECAVNAIPWCLKQQPNVKISACHVFTFITVLQELKTNKKSNKKKVIKENLKLSCQLRSKASWFHTPMSKIINLWHLPVPPKTEGQKLLREDITNVGHRKQQVTLNNKLASIFGIYKDTKKKKDDNSTSNR